MISILEVALRLLLATFIGGVIGFQREQAERPAGLRTHVMVCVGSTIFTIASLAPLGDTDPTRIAAQIVTGIGFLGAGTIINQGDIVLGLTTAASLWATAGLGLAAGFGLYPLALIGGVLVFLTLSLFKPFAERISGGEEKGTLFVQARGTTKSIDIIENVLQKAEIHSKTTELARGDQLTTFKYYIDLPQELDPDDVIHKLVQLPGIEKAKWEGLGPQS